jgi:hypothetical protein
MREYLYSASRVWTAPECPLFEWTSFFGGEQMARIIFTILKYLYSPFIILVIALLVGIALFVAAHTYPWPERAN